MNSEALRLLGQMYDACSGPYCDWPNLNAAYNELRALLSAQEPTGWRPIETAPKDGRLIWLTNGGSMYVGFWGAESDEIGDERWVDFYRMQYAGRRSPNWTKPTHWQPRLRTPSELAKQEAK